MSRPYAALVLMCALLLKSTIADARPHRHHAIKLNYEAALPKSVMVNIITAQGCRIFVNPNWALKFQRFFELLKEKGYSVPCRIVACWAPSNTHKAGSNHHIGGACDIQFGWNRGPSFVYHMRSIVQEAGLHDGCSFGDCGHVEAVRGLFNHAPNLYASVQKWKDKR